MKLYILLSIPDGFEEKFYNMINNFNMLNQSDIKIESTYNADPGYVAIPKSED